MEINFNFSGSNASVIIFGNINPKHAERLALVCGMLSCH